MPTGTATLSHGLRVAELAESAARGDVTGCVAAKGAEFIDRRAENGHQDRH